jgi:HAD superfamily hydrolase (TIGR01509 family)
VDRPDALLFDLDGTLIDSNRLHRRAWQAAAEERGLVLEDEGYARMVGRGVEAVRAVFHDLFGQEAPFAEILARRLALAAEWRSSLQTRPGAAEVLAWARSRAIRIAVGTTTHRGETLDVLERAGLRSFVEFVVGGDEVIEQKPAPDVYLACARLVGVPPERCLVVEDTSTGALAARRAGIPYVVVPDIVPPEPDIGAGAVAVFASLTELCDRLAAADGPGGRHPPARRSSAGT